MLRLLFMSLLFFVLSLLLLWLMLLLLVLSLVLLLLLLVLVWLLWLSLSTFWDFVDNHSIDDEVITQSLYLDFRAEVERFVVVVVVLLATRCAHKRPHLLA